jgi:hypothetical protein
VQAQIFILFAPRWARSMQVSFPWDRSVCLDRFVNDDHARAPHRAARELKIGSTSDTAAGISFANQA